MNARENKGGKRGLTALATASSSGTFVQIGERFFLSLDTEAVAFRELE